MLGEFLGLSYRIWIGIVIITLLVTTILLVRKKEPGANAEASSSKLWVWVIGLIVATGVMVLIITYTPVFGVAKTWLSVTDPPKTGQIVPAPGKRAPDRPRCIMRTVVVGREWSRWITIPDGFASLETDFTLEVSNEIIGDPIFLLHPGEREIPRAPGRTGRRHPQEAKLRFRLPDSKEKSVELLIRWQARSAGNVWPGDDQCS